jgi:hypothetical protein
MAAIDNTQISNILNALTPTGGTAGFPTAFTAMSAGIMKLRLNSTLSTASAAGTDIGTQTSGYTAGGWSLGTTSSTASSAGSAVGVPAITQSFVSSGSPTAVVSFDLVSSAAVRGFWGPFNAQPVNVGSGNTFQVVGGSGAAAGIQISLT